MHKFLFNFFMIFAVVALGTFFYVCYDAGQTIKPYLDMPLGQVPLRILNKELTIQFLSLMFALIWFNRE